MTRERIAHIVYSYLPVTQNWIYTQLRCNTAFDHTVVSCIEETTAQFPWSSRYTAFPSGRWSDRVKKLLARYWLRQPDAFFRRTLAVVQPAVVHGHFSTESWRILKNVRAAGLPLITTFYGLDVDKLPRRRRWKQRYPELFSYGSYFLVEGPFMGSRLIDIGCPREKVRIISLGVDRALYRQDGSVTRMDDSRVRILFVGLEREKKGAPDAAAVFIAAAKQNSRLELHILGDGRYRSRLRQMFASAEVGNRVTFHGYLSFEQYRQELLASDVLLVPSCYAADGDCEGGAPVVAIEAQVAGIPVVGTRHCDIPHVVVHGETGLLSDEHDCDSMTVDLLRLGNDAALRHRMGERGKKHTALQHDSIRQAERLADVYRTVISQRSVTKHGE